MVAEVLSPPAPAEAAAPDEAAVQAWELVQAAQAGDTGAFAKLYERYHPVIFRFVHYRVAHRQQAEDLAADVFVRAFSRIGSFTWQGRDVGAWLVTIARNLVADYYKSGRYRKEIVVGDVLDADAQDESPEADPAAATVRHLVSRTVQEALADLTEDQRQVVVLRFVHGLSVAETAQQLGKRESAVKAAAYRAKLRLAAGPALQALGEGWVRDRGGDGFDAAVRAWARQRGMDVGARGRLPVEVLHAYRRAHRTGAPVQRVGGRRG